MNIGQSLPIFFDGKLHASCPRGELVCSSEMIYPGGFEVQVETEIRLSLHSRVRTLIIPVVVQAKMKHLAGRLLFRLKPPPSDRLWYGFYRTPKFNLELEPIVSSKAVTWSMIHQIVLKKISEVMSEFIVLPNMDDILLPSLVLGDRYMGERPFEMEKLPHNMTSMLFYNNKTSTENTSSKISFENTETPDLRKRSKSADFSREHLDWKISKSAIQMEQLDFLCASTSALPSIKSELKLPSHLNKSCEKFDDDVRTL